MRRRPSFPTLAVWLGVTVVVVMSLALLRDLARVTNQSEAGRDQRADQ